MPDSTMTVSNDRMDAFIATIAAQVKELLAIPADPTGRAGIIPAVCPTPQRSRLRERMAADFSRDNAAPSGREPWFVLPLKISNMKTSTGRLKARMEGAKAALENRKMDANTYDETDDLHFEWLAGWVAAKTDRADRLTPSGEDHHCQNVHADICLASRADGVTCPHDSCDIDDGVVSRQNAEVSDRHE